MSVEIQDKPNNKKVSIVMMSTFSGSSYKAPRLIPIIHHLANENLLANSYGMPQKSDQAEYSEDELRYLKRNSLMSVLMKISNRLLLAVGSHNSYLTREKIFGFFARHFFKADGEMVLLKPRPASLVKYYKSIGKTVIVEASEAHTEYTYESLKKECMSLSLPLVKNPYTNRFAIEDFSEGVMNADRIICLSEFSAGTYRTRGVSPEKICVTGLTAGMPLVKPRNVSSEAITYISVANHSILKGTLHLLRIWRKYKIPNKLMIVGHIHADLRPYIEEFKSENNVVFTGSLKRDEIEHIYTENKCVGVLLSVSEGFSRSVLECLLTATPVIVTECCTCDIVENGINGFIVDSSNEKAIYDRIAEYNNMSPEKYKEMAESAYKRSSEVESDFLSKYVGAIFSE